MDLKLLELDPLILRPCTVAAMVCFVISFTWGLQSKVNTEIAQRPASSPEIKREKSYQAIEALRSEEKRRQLELSKKIVDGRTNTDGTSRY